MENNNTEEKIYRGYKKICGDTAFINDYMYNPSKEDWVVNEYLIIENTDEKLPKEMRWDGENFVPLKLPNSRIIKGRNSLQRCALDMLNNPNITVCAILGLPGSGKSYLSLASALYAVKEKGTQQGITIVREPVSSGRTSGYLPGGLDDKIGLYFKPIEDQLNEGEFELHKLQQRGELEIITPHYIKGRSINAQYILVEESEDLTEKQVRMIGTRVGTESKIVFSGDYKQSEIDASENNVLVRMCKFFKGTPMFASIFLEDDVRSETSKLFASMYFD